MTFYEFPKKYLKKRKVRIPGQRSRRVAYPKQVTFTVWNNMKSYKLIYELIPFAHRRPAFIYVPPHHDGPLCKTLNVPWKTEEISGPVAFHEDWIVDLRHRKINEMA